MRAGAGALAAVLSACVHAGAAQPPVVPMPPDAPAELTVRAQARLQPDAVHLMVHVTNTGAQEAAVCAGLGAQAFQASVEAGVLIVRCALALPPRGWDAGESPVPRVRTVPAAGRWQGTWTLALPVRPDLPAPVGETAAPATSHLRVELGAYPPAVLAGARALPDGTLAVADPAALARDQRTLAADLTLPRAIPLQW